MQRGHWLLPSDKPGSGPCAVLRGVPNSKLEGACPAGVLVLDLGVRFKLRAPRWAQRHSDLGRPKPKRRATVAVAVCWLCAQVWQLTIDKAVWAVGPPLHRVLTPPHLPPPSSWAKWKNQVLPRPPAPGDDSATRKAQESPKPQDRPCTVYTTPLAYIHSP